MATNSSMPRTRGADKPGESCRHCEEPEEHRYAWHTENRRPISARCPHCEIVSPIEDIDRERRPLKYPPARKALSIASALLHFARTLERVGPDAKHSHPNLWKRVQAILRAYDDHQDGTYGGLQFVAARFVTFVPRVLCWSSPDIYKYCDSSEVRMHLDFAFTWFCDAYTPIYGPIAKPEATKKLFFEAARRWDTTGGGPGGGWLPSFKAFVRELNPKLLMGDDGELSDDSIHVQLTAIRREWRARKKSESRARATKQPKRRARMKH